MSERSEEKELKKIENLPRRRQRQTLGAISTMLCFTAALGAYNFDAKENEQLANKSEISLKTIQDNQSDTSIIFTDGFNTNNANYLARKLGPAVQLINHGGNIESVATGNSSPNPKRTAELIIDYAEKNDITHVSLFGYSIGGISTIKTALEIIRQSKDVTIDVIYLASTPYSIDSLRPDKKELLEGLTSFLANVPRSEYSSYIKFLVTLGFHKEGFMPGSDAWESIQNFDTEEFSRQWDDAYKVVTNHERPNLSTLEQQINLARTDVGKDIKAIGDETTAANVPTVVYLLIAEPGSDNTVDNAAAATSYNTALLEAGVPGITVRVEGSQHAEYYTEDSITAYTNGLAENQSRILASIDARYEEEWHGPLTANAGPSTDTSFPEFRINADGGLVGESNGTSPNR